VAGILAGILGALIVVASIAALLFIPIYVLKAILDSGEALAAVLPTLLWVGLIVWLAMRYDIAIRSLFASVKKRIDEGANVEFSWFKLISAVQPISEEEQRKRQEKEMEEAAGSTIGPETPASYAQPDPSPNPTPGSSSNHSSGPSASSPARASEIYAGRYSKSWKAHRFAEAWLTRVYGAALRPNVRIGSYEVDAAILPSPTGKMAAGIVEIKYIGHMRQLLQSEDALISLRQRFLVVDTVKVDYLEAVFVVENADLARKATESLRKLSELWKETSIILVAKVIQFSDLKSMEEGTHD
jgi:hypothetical protein